MSAPDLTIVLNVHREGVLLSYTLRSLVDATLHAASKGLSVELVVVADAPDEATRAVVRDFDSAAFVRIEKIEVANRSLGPSRNAGLARASGTHVAIVDGDDLYSFNYLVAMHAAARSDERVVVLPEFVVWFGADWLVQRFVPLARSGRFRLAGFHTFVSCILAPTPFLRDLGYRDCAGSRVYAYEDYDLNCRAVAAGGDVRTATDAVLFYRKHGRSIMAGIGDASRFIAPPSAFYAPEAFVAGGDGDDVIDDPETLSPGLMAYRRSHRLAELVAHAGAIEPRIELAKVREAPIFTTAHFERTFGATYYDICRELAGANFDVALLVASLADCPPLLLRAVEKAQRCLILQLGRADGTALDLPAGSRTIALGAYAALPAHRRPEMIVRLLHGFAPSACLHVVLGTEISAFLNGFAETLERNAVVLYDLRRPDADGERARAWTLDAEVYTHVDLVASDDPSILDTLVACIPIYAGKVTPMPDDDGLAAADAWLAATRRRLTPRPTETRWTS